MTTRSPINALKGRLVAALFMSGALAGAALAQTDSTPPSAAQSLSCLKPPSATLSYPEKHRLDRTCGFIRLHFSKPDAEPRVEELSNTAREDMQDLVYCHVGAYRLPCQQPQDGTVSAVQEFQFDNSMLDEAPVPEDAAPSAALCIVMPRRDPDRLDTLTREMHHVMAEATFTGDGTQAPEVKLVYSSGNKRLEAAVIERVQAYRMPCRTGQEKPQTMELRFTFVPYGHRQTVLKREAFALAEFLGFMQGAQQLQAYFDFSTMNCLFKLHFTNFGPARPNRVREVGAHDPNRTVFLKWLGERQIAFASDRQANELFGTTLQVEVPCGKLDLAPAAAAAAPGS
ncbi:hypothetical protein QRD43_04490 [Pelomonas sp. APW6]|uniref:TonB C-terminal domain-containing protein n=1 Tax=Roseateles subflavus TaxID=3053353 RepID=A0ABT7LE71_9BURK|nr:hypothetical protein [Pelomonas sp. APW6]MDL5031158.1 hypothetical protein [Pelomonas sp. APW6]